MNRFTTLLYVVLLTSFNLLSDTTIYWGNNRNKISIDISDEGIWSPLYFDVDQNSNIHIPDFFKGRVAIFTPEGELLKEIKIKEGISSRMNYFSLNSNNTYTTYDNYSLYLLDSNGGVIWTKEYGLGSIPNKIFSDEFGIYIAFNSNYYFNSYNEPANSTLEDLFESNSSQIIYKDETKTISVKNKKVEILDFENNVKNIAIPQNGILGTGYWVIYGEDHSLYSSIHNKKSLIIKKLD
ncbi:hypothetical protein EW093_05635 [Thiospirochaeta perfilievii]|uniref:Uncharacterized protein n=1 Tax=Thiospirochaeta perfilievii TaxID=252967 RepID=A0A5C1Q9R1_9SPIO|nr:hypothetical protein [Thiospirochaeta perfilievii]QEN04207.1 hypothetical protein EW093_05635 [Thiospirochaeta perfilievii]